MTGRVLQLSAKPETPGEFGLPKRAVPELFVSATGAAGDFNRYRTEQLLGDRDQALLLMTQDLLDTLRSEGWPVERGDLGENLTLGGVPESSLAPGVRLRLGQVELQISKPCDPCSETYSLPYIGPERHAWLYPARSLAKAGAWLAGGSDWPVDPLFPWYAIERAVTRTADSWYGYAKSPLNANQRTGKFVLDSLWDRPTHPEGWYFRSDHVPYARLNVPALFFTTNLHADYHTPRDNPDRIDYAKLTRMTKWMYLTGWIVANAKERPTIDVGFQLER